MSIPNEEIKTHEVVGGIVLAVFTIAGWLFMTGFLVYSAHYVSWFDFHGGGLLLFIILAFASMVGMALFNFWAGAASVVAAIAVAYGSVEIAWLADWEPAMYSYCEGHKFGSHPPERDCVNLSFCWWLIMWPIAFFMKAAAEN